MATALGQEGTRRPARPFIVQVAALRKAIGGHYPSLADVHLTDYRVRVLDTGRGTGAVTRVLVDSSSPDQTWTTIGVSENIIEASWQALYDSIVFALLHAGS